MSGLQMNTEKTKLVWLGRKKTSKDKLDVNIKLDWGVTAFTLLGLEYCIDLEDMVEKNYDLAIKKILKTTQHWNKRYLTPLGKIIIINHSSYPN